MQRPRTAVHFEIHGVGRPLRRSRRQRTLEGAAEMKGAGADPHEFGAAAIKLEIDAVAVLRKRYQRRESRQRLWRHYSRTISRWISPVTTASSSPMYILISLRTPKSGR